MEPVVPKMPRELWLQTFQYLEPYTVLGSAKRISRELYHIAATFTLAYGLLPKIWLRIFERYLDYFDLKRLMKTSKTFRRLLINSSTPRLDARLFREKPSPSLMESRIPVMHRVFHYIDIWKLGAYGARITPTAGYAKDYDRVFKYYKFEDLTFPAALRENLTSPPVTKVTIDFSQHFLNTSADPTPRPELIVEIDHSDDARCVLVSDILKAILQVLSLSHCRKIDRSFFGILMRKYRAGDAQVRTYYHMIVDDNYGGLGGFETRWSLIYGKSGNPRPVVGHHLQLKPRWLYHFSELTS